MVLQRLIHSAPIPICRDIKTYFNLGLFKHTNSNNQIASSRKIPEQKGMMTQHFLEFGGKDGKYSSKEEHVAFILGL
jgi:hypothetical protein